MSEATTSSARRFYTRAAAHEGKRKPRHPRALRWVLMLTGCQLWLCLLTNPMVSYIRRVEAQLARAEEMADLRVLP